MVEGKERIIKNFIFEGVRGIFTPGSKMLHVAPGASTGEVYASEDGGI
jgi:hypothetical protein